MYEGYVPKATDEASRVRHLTLPTNSGAAVIVAEKIDKIVPLGDFRCRIHLLATESGMVKPGDHNVFEVQVSAEDVRDGIAEMDDGDVFDPWNLEMVGDD